MTLSYDNGLRHERVNANTLLRNVYLFGQLLIILRRRSLSYRNYVVKELMRALPTTFFCGIYLEAATGGVL